MGGHGKGHGKNKPSEEYPDEVEEYPEDETPVDNGEPVEEPVEEYPSGGYETGGYEEVYIAPKAPEDYTYEYEVYEYVAEDPSLLEKTEENGYLEFEAYPEIPEGDLPADYVDPTDENYLDTNYAVIEGHYGDQIPEA